MDGRAELARVRGRVCEGDDMEREPTEGVAPVLPEAGVVAGRTGDENNLRGKDGSRFSMILEATGGGPGEDPQA